MKYILEGHKLFPYIAWTTVILFSAFTYNLVYELKKSVDALEEKTSLTQSQINAKREF